MLEPWTRVRSDLPWAPYSVRFVMMVVVIIDKEQNGGDEIWSVGRSSFTPMRLGYHLHHSAVK